MSNNDDKSPVRYGISITLEEHARLEELARRLGVEGPAALLHSAIHLVEFVLDAVQEGGTVFVRKSDGGLYQVDTGIPPRNEDAGVA